MTTMLLGGFNAMKQCSFTAVSVTHDRWDDSATDHLALISGARSMLSCC